MQGDSTDMVHASPFITVGNDANFPTINMVDRELVQHLMMIIVAMLCFGLTLLMWVYDPGRKSSAIGSSWRNEHFKQFNNAGQVAERVEIPKRRFPFLDPWGQGSLQVGSIDTIPKYWGQGSLQVGSIDTIPKY